MIWLKAFRGGVGFGHVLTFLRLAVPPVAGAVINLRFGIDPNSARATARRGRSSRRLGRSRRRRCSRSLRRGRRCRGRGGCSCRGAVPLLYALVALARPFLGRTRPVRAVFAKSRGSCRRTRWNPGAGGSDFRRFGFSRGSFFRSGLRAVPLLYAFMSLTGPLLGRT